MPPADGRAGLGLERRIAEAGRERARAAAAEVRLLRDACESSGDGADDAAERQLHLARALLSSGARDEAADLLDAALAQWPGHAGWEVQAGWQARADGARGDALAIAGAAVDRDPADAAAWHLLGALQHDAGDLPAADRSFAVAVRQAPASPELLLRRFETQCGRRDWGGARESIERYLQLRPDDAHARQLQVLVLVEEGELAAARRVLLRRLRTGPRTADDLQLLALLQGRCGRARRALRTLRQALACDPFHLEAHRTRAELALAVDEVAQALDALQVVLHQVPHDLDAAVLAASVLARAGQLEQAHVWATSAVARAAGRADAWQALAQVRLQQGRAVEADSAASQALLLAPDDAAALGVAAEVALALREPDRAQQLLSHAIGLQPGDVQLRVALGRAQLRAGGVDAALQQAEALLAERPGWAPALRLRAQALLAAGSGETAQACGQLLRADPLDADAIALAQRAAALGHRAARGLAALVPAEAWRQAFRASIGQAIHRHGWSTLQGLVRDAQEDVSEDLWIDTAALHALSLDAATDRPGLALRARAWARAMKLRAGFSSIAAAWGAPAAGRVRIGYVAGQLHQPLLRRVLSAHAQDAAQVFLYAAHPPDGLPPHVHVRRLGPRLAEDCAADQIDVLIEAGGLHPHEGQFEVLWACARRLAPVQLAWLGAWGPTGGLFDGILADAVSVPAAHEPDHDETVLRLAGGQWCWDPPPGAPAVAPPPARPSGHVCFGAVARGLRIGPACLDAWARVLQAVPRSRLRLVGEMEADLPQRREILDRLAAHGVAPDRIAFDPFLPPGRFHAWFAQVDVLLDSLPGSGGLSLLDALWMGVPVVTLAGAWAGARQGASLLHAIGREDWVADSADAFVCIAARLADDLPSLELARAGQRARMAASPLMDGRRLAAQIESICTTLRAGLPVAVADSRERVRSHARWRLDRLLEGRRRIAMPAVADPVPDVSVVVVLFNQAGLSWRTLQALADQRGVTFEAIVVDNASTDRTGEMLARVDGALLLPQPENAGFLLGANTGAARARGRHIAFLNSDAVLQPGALAAAVSALDADASIGALGGRVVLCDGTLQEVGNRIFRDGRTAGIGRGEDPFGHAARAARGTDFVSGAFLVTPAAVWQRLGGFDAHFAPAYHEDADYGLRVWQAGLRVVVEPSVVVEHLEWGSAEGDSASTLMERNRHRFAQRHAAWLAGQPRARPQRLDGDRWRSPEDGAARPRVLFVDNEVPHMARGGGLPRARLMLQALDGWPVTLFPLWTLQDDLRAVYRTVPAGIEVALGHGLAGLEAFLERRHGVYDHLLVSRPTNLAALQPLRQRRPDLFAGMRLVYDAEAVFAVREIASAAVRGKPMPALQARAHVEAEVALATGAGDVLVVSDADRAHFDAAGHRTHVLSHAVTLRMQAPGPQERQGLLFVGALHPDTPNEDGLLWFVDQVLPLLAARLGAAPVLRVVGPCSSSRVAALAGPGLQVLGPQERLEPHYDAARVFIAPARFAGGVPAKVIEAAAGGVPCVASALLVQQLGWPDGEAIRGAATAQAFAGAILDLLADDASWRRQQQGAWKVCAQRYDTADFRRRLRDVLAREDAARTEPPGAGSRA
jgi:GT2 family glycosyltransferase/tetratricopeptide (TPR) repeat protein